MFERTMYIENDQWCQFHTGTRLYYYLVSDVGWDCCVAFDQECLELSANFRLVAGRQPHPSLPDGLLQGGQGKHTDVRVRGGVEKQ